jgi:hypothetical protein
MPRTNAADVIATLGKDYDSRNSPSLDQYLASAELMIDDVASCAVAKSISQTDAKYKDIEKWLTCHLYCQSDKSYQSRSNTGVSGSFQGQTAMGLDSTLYGQTAKRLDRSGCLAELDSEGIASVDWLGLPESQQTDYEDRD